MRDTFIRCLTRIVAERSDVMLVTGDLGFKVLDDFATRFPRNYLNVGVAEQNLTGVATGLALCGRIVFTYSIANFPTLRCLEQLRNDVCYHQANVKVVVIGAGFSYGALGFSHHATEDVSVLRALPGLTLVTPADHWEVAEATAALVARPGPACLRLDKSSAPDTPAEAMFEIGRARRLREGADVTFVTAGGILGEVLRASEILARDAGIEARVCSMHTIKPLDDAAVVAAARETGGLVTVEEHVLAGGLGAAVAEVLADQHVSPHHFLRIGLPDCFPSVVGSQAYLRRHFGLDADGISRAVVRLLGRVA
jgi:transketolase